MAPGSTHSATKWFQKGLVLMAVLMVVITIGVLDRTDLVYSVGRIFNKSINASRFSDQSQNQPPSAARNRISHHVSVNDKINSVVKKRLEERTALKQEVCKSPSYRTMLGKKTVKSQSWKDIADGRIKVCSIPKCGTSYMRYLNTHLLKTLDGKGKTRQPQTMVIVREPFSRIVSGYIGKIVTNPPWQRNYGSKIIRKFRPLGSANSKRCGHDVTFPEHLKYVVHSEKTGWLREHHFYPMYRQCNPCNTHFDYIVHLETIKDDLAFALKSVNLSTEMDFSDEEFTLRGKAEDIIKHKNDILKCETMCSALGKVWWSFHARGFVSTEIPFPLKTEEECRNITQTAFSDMSWNAHLQSAGRIDKSKQRTETLKSLYLQATLEDRLKVQEVMMKDFELYGYNLQPDDLFPELQQT